MGPAAAMQRHAFVLFTKVGSVQKLLAHVESGHDIVLRDHRLKVGADIDEIAILTLRITQDRFLKIYVQITS